jgi:hypothetical protein
MGHGASDAPLSVGDSIRVFGVTHLQPFRFRRCRGPGRLAECGLIPTVPGRHFLDDEELSNDRDSHELLRGTGVD